MKFVRFGKNSEASHDGDTSADRAKRTFKLKKIRTTALVAIAAGLIFASLIPVAANQNDKHDSTDNATVQADDQDASAGEANASQNESDGSEAQTGTATNNVESSTHIETDGSSYSSSSHTSISIKMSGGSSQDGEQSGSDTPNVTINGQPVEIPDNGRINSRQKDDTSDTRIRARIDRDDSGSASINISTDGSAESGGD